MKIISVVHSSTFAGPHNQAIVLSRYGPHDIKVVIPDEPGNAAAKLVDEGVAVLEAALVRPGRRTVMHPWKFAKAYLAQVRSLQQIIIEERAEVVHARGLLNIDAPLAARLQHIPLVWQIVDTRPSALLRRVFGPVVGVFADAVMTTGMRVARMHNLYGRLRAKTSVYYPPVTATLSEERRELARSYLGVAGNAILIGTVGNFNPQKGHIHALRVMSQVASSAGRLVEIRIAGSPHARHMAYVELLRAAAEEMVLGPEAVVVNPSIKGSDLAQAFDLFVLLPNRNSEGVPTVLLEAMAAGVPVVTYDVGSIKEVISSDRYGFVLPYGDSAGISECLRRLINSESLRSSVSARARERVLAMCSPEKLIEAVDKAHAVAKDTARRRALSP